MQQWQRMRTLSAIALMVSLLLLLIELPSSIWIAVGLPLFAAIGCAGIFYSIRMEREQQETANQRLIIELISHYRHDWMNDIQLLFGYISLKKYDKLEDCMDKIRLKALEESSIAKLGIPSLVAFFISFRLYYNAVALELEMEQDVNLAALPLDKEKVSRLVQMTVKLFHAHAVNSVEELNVLSVQFDLDEDALLFDLIYQGSYEELALQQGIQEILSAFNDQFATIDEEYTAKQAVMTIRLPFAIKR